MGATETRAPPAGRDPHQRPPQCQTRSEIETIMFARIALRFTTFRHLWKQEAAFRDRRVAGVLIAFFGR